ncbi:MAG: hypothetical protein ACKVU2_06430 [Saprospiraceae bacterium]
MNFLKLPVLVSSGIIRDANISMVKAGFVKQLDSLVAMDTENEPSSAINFHFGLANIEQNHGGSARLK